MASPEYWREARARYAIDTALRDGATLEGLRDALARRESEMRTGSPAAGDEQPCPHCRRGCCARSAHFCTTESP